ncbi:MAG: putrescine transport system ATP-binding protein [Candidatus Azotimanducaceae bacterium]|jgi:putrescine transport system ATP-binding protein
MSMPNSEFAVEIRQVSKRFGDVTVVDVVSLDIRKGEIFALLGGSGCGKTTLLRMLAGFETPSSGEILINGEPMQGRAPYERPVNMMFQSYALFPHMSVRQNIAFGLKQESLTKKAIIERTNEVLELVQMTEFADRKPAQLSGGQQQRVALARSLAKKPSLLLLDEPMGALDKKLRMEMQLELANIIEAVGVTCVMVTHDQEEAMTMADRIAVMHQGQIRQVGRPSEIYEKPNSRMTAEFIGTINLFPARITSRGDLIHLDSPMLECPVEASDDNPPPGEDCLVAIRPEKIQLSGETGNTGPNHANGLIDDIAYLGSHMLVHVRLTSGQLVHVQVNNLDPNSRRNLNYEQPVSITWQPGAVILIGSEAH